jgi:hypothetical protein
MNAVKQALLPAPHECPDRRNDAAGAVKEGTRDSNDGTGQTAADRDGARLSRDGQLMSLPFAGMRWGGWVMTGSCSTKWRPKRDHLLSVAREDACCLSCR